MMPRARKKGAGREVPQKFKGISLEVPHLTTPNRISPWITLSNRGEDIVEGPVPSRLALLAPCA